LKLNDGGKGGKAAAATAVAAGDGVGGKQKGEEKPKLNSA
jgi:hypothetical protein